MILLQQGSLIATLSTIRHGHLAPAMDALGDQASPPIAAIAHVYVGCSLASSDDRTMPCPKHGAFLGFGAESPDLEGCIV